MVKKTSLLVNLGMVALLGLVPLRVSRNLEGLVNRAEATILRVGGGEGDYPTLQSAINAAAPYDSVLVRDGTIGWSENPRYIDHLPIQINGSQNHGGNLTIMSEHGREYTRIDNWNYAAGVVWVANVNDVVVQGFSIDGRYSPYTLSGAYVGIECRYSSQVRISDCYPFNTGNKAINSLNSHLLVEDSKIQVDAPAGRGVANTNSTDSIIRRNYFTVGPTAFSYITADGDTIAFNAIDPTSTAELYDNTYDVPPHGGGTLVDPPWRAVIDYGPANIHATTEVITPYHEEIQYLRDYGTPEQQAAYNCPAITDIHDIPGRGLVDLFGIQTSVGEGDRYSEPSSWGGIKTIYK